jgi:hypothetical protein
MSSAPALRPISPFCLFVCLLQSPSPQPNLLPFWQQPTSTRQTSPLHGSSLHRAYQLLYIHIVFWAFRFVCFVLQFCFVCVCMSLPLGPCMSHEALPGHSCKLPSFQLLLAHQHNASAQAESPRSPRSTPQTTQHASTSQRPPTPSSRFYAFNITFSMYRSFPACTGASPACRLLPSEESHSVLGDGASLIGH